MKINLGDFKSTQEMEDAVLGVLHSGKITEGKYTLEFEKEFAKYIGVRHCIACVNGTQGLMLVLMAVRILNGGKEDLKFIVPASTFPATLNSVILTNHKSLLCDVGEDFLINPNVKEEYIVDMKISGVIPVHLFGYAADMDKLLKLKEKYGLFILEDCCEALGSSYKGKKVGSIGDAGVFSMYMSHPLGVGEFSCITTNNTKLAEVIRSIKNHGRAGSNLEFRHKYVGTNAKTTEFMSALALVQLTHIDEIIKKRQRVVKQYNERIKNPHLIFPKYSEECSYLGYPLGAKTKVYKEKIIKKLTELGIETRGFFPCLANQEAYDFKDKKEVIRRVPVSVYLEENFFYVPCHQYMKDSDIDYVITALNDG